MSVKKKIAAGILFIFLAFNLFIVVAGKTYFYKAVYYNFANIDDYTIFENRIIQKSQSPQPWPISSAFNKKKLPANLQHSLEDNKSIAFLVLKEDSLVHEQYWEGYTDSSLSNSFSVAKSFVSALIGVAIKEGKIKSVEQYVWEFLPEFKEGEKKNIKIKHLLMMSSGLDWNESYADPLSVTTEAYYGNDLKKAIASLKVEAEPGKEFSYKSGNTQILGFILEKATGTSLSDYIEEKLWQPMGAVNNALWSIDHDAGHEKAYCCINSNARDFARLGSLYLHHGNWKGNQLIDSVYVAVSTSPSGLKFKNGVCDFYGYQWWVVPEYKGIRFFYARGILGQLIVVIPDKKIVAVRLGEKNGERVQNHFGLAMQVAEGVYNFKF